MYRGGLGNLKVALTFMYGKWLYIYTYINKYKTCDVYLPGRDFNNVSVNTVEILKWDIKIQKCGINLITFTI